MVEQEQTGLRKECERLAGLQQRFALVPVQAVLEARRQEFLTERDALIVRIGQAQSREPKAIRGELQRLEQELLLLEQEMRTQGSNLYQQLASHLSPSQLSALNKVLAKPVLTLGADEGINHVKVFSQLARKLVNKQFRQSLFAAENAESILALLEAELTL